MALHSPWQNKNHYSSSRPHFSIYIYTYIHIYLWRRQWPPTPVFLPGKSHGQRSLVGCSPWGHKESGMTEWLTHKKWSTRINMHIQVCFIQNWRQTTDLALRRFDRPPVECPGNLSTMKTDLILLKGCIVLSCFQFFQWEAVWQQTSYCELLGGCFSRLHS